MGDGRAHGMFPRRDRPPRLARADVLRTATGAPLVQADQAVLSFIIRIEASVQPGAIILAGTTMGEGLDLVGQCNRHRPLGMFAALGLAGVALCSAIPAP